MLTHSVAVDVWDVCPKAWLWFCQWRLSALQISHGGPALSTPQSAGEAHRCYSTGGGKSNENGRVCLDTLGRKPKKMARQALEMKKKKISPEIKKSLGYCFFFLLLLSFFFVLRLRAS